MSLLVHDYLTIPSHSQYNVSLLLFQILFSRIYIHNNEV